MSKQVTEVETPITVPAHLRQYVVDQDYGKYTPIDQAVWRYVLRQNSHFLSQKGFGSYLGGLNATGMSTERIPNMAEMNAALAPLGWGVVTVDGFIPAVAFFDFQAHGLLPIAGDIRTLKHIAYTPAPDIIHESAGHAPMLAEPGYGEFVKLFGSIGAKALASKEDHAVYEAIRLLSIVKEDPSASEDEAAAAEADVVAKVAAVTHISEASELARLYWWTVEYGLIGTLDDPKIYGAGLLSSMGESRSCLNQEVEKIPFSLAGCIAKENDITRPQPNLFVCENFEQLAEAVQEFAKTMAYQVGGTESLHKAVDSGATATAVYSSGLQVSGTFTDLVLDDQGEAIYLKTTGSSALAVDDQELPGHGRDYHAEGFGSPIGRVKGVETPLEDFTGAQLRGAGLREGQRTALDFASGVRVEGVLSDVQRENGKIVLLKWEDCTVTFRDQTLFRAEWGMYDMAVGANIVSVFAGAADRESFHTTAHAVSKVLTRRPNYSEADRMLHGLYQTVRTLREEASSDAEVRDVLTTVVDDLDRDFPSDWLLRVEVLEILTKRGLLPSLQQRVRGALATIATQKAEVSDLIDNGLKLLAQ